MKYLKIVFINLLLLGLGSCDYRYGGEPYYDYNSQYTPVIMDRADLEQSIRIIGPREIKDYGKSTLKIPFSLLMKSSKAYMWLTTVIPATLRI